MPRARRRRHRLSSASRTAEQDCRAASYVATEEGWLFLAVVIDLFSRRVVGWSLQPHMERGICLISSASGLGKRAVKTGDILSDDTTRNFGLQMRHRLRRS